ncbi:MAG: hypothetical protein COA73_00850 [Candidatus Hydrogenedentota bacterium]|nr:MAG: hypothetical protein COA73_00850 [Candidatus Hydrogenedentota bacterium]
MKSFYQIVMVSGSKLLSLGTLFLAGILVARVAGPVGFGYYNVGLTILLLVDGVVGQPLDNAMVRFYSLHKDSKHSVDSVQGAIFRIKMLLGIGLIAMVFIFSDVLSPMIMDSNAPQYILLVAAVGITCLLAVRSTACYLQIRQRFQTYATLDVLQGAIRFIGICVLFFMGTRAPEAYLAVYGAGALISFGFYFITVPQPYLRASWPNKADQKRMVSYIGVTSAIVILGTVTGRIDVLLVMIFGGAEMAGHYSAAAQLAFLGALLAGYMAVVFQPKVVQLSREKKLAKLIRLNGLLAGAVSLACIPIAIWFLPWIMPLLFGEGFIASVPILQIMLIGTCADLFIMPILLPFSIQVLAKEALIGEIVITCLFFVLVFAGSNFSALRMAWLVSGIRLAKLGLYLFIVVRYLRKETRDDVSLPSTVV